MNRHLLSQNFSLLRRGDNHFPRARRSLAVELCGDLVAEHKMVGVEPVVGEGKRARDIDRAEPGLAVAACLGISRAMSVLTNQGQ